MCARRITSCSSYAATAGLFNNIRPAAYKLSSLWVCEPSEREIWTTTGTFKIGDAAHAPEEKRANCPGFPTGPDPAGRRKPPFEGKKDFVQTKICPLFLSGRPAGNDDVSCSTYVNAKAPTANGGRISCADRLFVPPAASSTPTVAPPMNVLICNASDPNMPPSCDADASDVAQQAIAGETNSDPAASSSGLPTSTVAAIATVGAVVAAAALAGGLYVLYKKRAAFQAATQGIEASRA